MLWYAVFLQMDIDAFCFAPDLFNTGSVTGPLPHNHINCACMQIVHGATAVVVVLAYTLLRGQMKEATTAAVTSSMYLSLEHTAVGMHALMEANQSAFVVADSLKTTNNKPRLSYVIARAPIYFVQCMLDLL
jgi:hypothetical protein